MAPQTPTGVTSATQKSMLQDESPLWKEAYERLEEGFKRRYETILAKELQVNDINRLENQLAALVEARKRRVEERRWTYTWHGKPKEIRQQLDTILDIVEKTAGIFITGSSREHGEAFSVLFEITDVLARYRLVEQVQLDQNSTSYKEFRSSIVDLYAKIFELQAQLASYLGKKTLSRLGFDALALGDWATKKAELRQADERCQTFAHIQTAELQNAGFEQLTKALDEQTALIDEIVAKCKNRREILTGIQQWISAFNPWADNHEVLKQLGEQYLESGKWLYSTDQFKEWKKSSKGVLVLQGSIGTGKSSLMSILLQHLVTTSSRVGFFYCSRQSMQQSHKSLSATDLDSLGYCLLRQLALLEDGLTLDPLVVEKYETRSGDSEARLTLTRTALEDLLMNVINQSQGAIVLIDALDEFPSATGLLGFLSHIMNKTSKLRVVLSTRPRPGVDVRTELERSLTNTFVTQIDMHDHTKEDIRALVNYEIFDSERGLKRPGSGMTKDQAERLEILLLQRSSAMFRWVVLQLELFISHDDDLRIRYKRDVEKRLLALAASTSSVLPRSDKELLWQAYDQVYLRNVGSHPEDPTLYQDVPADYVQRILYWTLCAFRPMHVTELAVALQEEDDDEVLEETEISRLGSNFIRLDADKFVVFTHHSVREYLLDSLPIGKSSIHKMPLSSFHAVASLRCVHQATAALSTLPTFEYIFKNNLKPDFETYAWTYWLKHFTKSSAEQKARESLCIIIDHISKSTNSGIPAQQIECIANYARRAKTTSTTQDSQATDMLLRTLEDVLEKLGATFERWTTSAFLECILACLVIARKDFSPSSVLKFALTCDQIFTRVLLHHGADPNEDSNVFHIAAKKGRSEIMGILLRRLHDPRILLEDADPGPSLLEEAINEQNFGCADRLWDVMMEYDFSFAERTTKNAEIAKQYSQSFGRIDRDLSDDSVHLVHNQQLLVPPNRLTFDAPVCSGCKTALNECLTTNDGPPVKVTFAANDSCPGCAAYLEKLAKATSNSESVPLILNNENSTLPRLIMQPYCGTRLYRQKTMNIWTISLQSQKDMTEEYRTEFEVCRGPAKSALFSAKFRSQDLCSGPFSSEAVDKMLQWMRDCDLHPECQLQSISETPRNFLDVQVPGRVKLVPYIKGSKYTFYSGKWGPKLKVSHLTEDKNGSTLMEEGVDFAAIPKSWADAAEITRLLGFQYLWIDGLCLVREELKSFTKGSAHISGYAAGASLVIASADTEASQGFATREPLPGHYCRLTYTEDGQVAAPGQFISMREPMTEAGSYLFASEWAQRGWTFLERYLARRQLIFSNQQFYWNCNRHLLSESSRVAQKPLWRIPQSDTSCNYSPLSSRADRSVWYRLIEYYTATAVLSLQSDKLKAIKQMAARLGAGDTYLMGIWANDLHNGITWQPRTIPRSLGGASDSTFPSWCWASMDVPVQFNVARRRRIQGRHDATLVRTEPGDGSANANAGADLDIRTLTLEGWLQETKSELRNREARYEIWARLGRQDSGLLSGRAFYVLLISQWVTSSWKGARWHGLVLARDGKGGFRRQGTYIGPVVEFEGNIDGMEGRGRFDLKVEKDLKAGEWRREEVTIS